ncbi:hypothetical protein DUI87_11728 [Hirundo rustica rustica]|uniref:Uncharacterized protein n=1 Tax=Hirundo rustica rustica TaxID=333673 RepID=A0A3M0KWX2_HIRRU|nr:hypothetical protein DUI87_11728 [Hirundo rustica rustica]
MGGRLKELECGDESTGHLVSLTPILRGWSNEELLKRRLMIIPLGTAEPHHFNGIRMRPEDPLLLQQDLGMWTFVHQPSRNSAAMLGPGADHDSLLASWPGPGERTARHFKLCSTMVHFITRDAGRCLREEQYSLAVQEAGSMKIGFRSLISAHEKGSFVVFISLCDWNPGGVCIQGSQKVAGYLVFREVFRALHVLNLINLTGTLRVVKLNVVTSGFAYVAEVPQGNAHRKFNFGPQKSRMKGGVLGAYRKVGYFQASLERRIQIYSCKEQWVWEEKSSSREYRFMDGLSQKAVRKPQGLISPAVQGPQTPALFKIQAQCTASDGTLQHNDLMRPRSWKDTKRDGLFQADHEEILNYKGFLTTAARQKADALLLEVFYGRLKYSRGKRNDGPRHFYKVVLHSGFLFTCSGTLTYSDYLLGISEAKGYVGWARTSALCHGHPLADLLVRHLEPGMVVGPDHPRVRKSCEDHLLRGESTASGRGEQVSGTIIDILADTLPSESTSLGAGEACLVIQEEEAKESNIVLKIGLEGQ